jgi:iron(III) transport system substrate-binding protein
MVRNNLHLGAFNPNGYRKIQMNKPRTNFGRRSLTALALGTLISALPIANAMAEGNVNIYSYRQPSLIKPLLDEFTKETGIETKVIFAKKGLSERIAAEGVNSPADILLSVGIGKLVGAREKGITQAVTNDTINANIPARYRDPEGHWFGVTTRARVIYASKERVEQESITYEELADPKWKGRICTRSGQHVYSIGLFASLVAHHGVEWTEKWLTDVKANLARKPAGNDRKQVKAIFSGECDIALGNTYYMGKMQTNEKEPAQKEWAASVKILFPNTEGRGTHVNISGVSLAKYSPNKANAIKLLEFLTSTKAQQIYAETNFEYPVRTNVPTSKLVDSWGQFKSDEIGLDAIAKFRKTASELVDKVGFNQGPSS